MTMQKYRVKIKTYKSGWSIATPQYRFLFFFWMHWSNYWGKIRFPGADIDLMKRWAWEFIEERIAEEENKRYNIKYSYKIKE